MLASLAAIFCKPRESWHLEELLLFVAVTKKVLDGLEVIFRDTTGLPSELLFDCTIAKIDCQLF
jgi:hypothetical protein